MQNKTSREEIAQAEGELAVAMAQLAGDPQDAPPRLTSPFGGDEGRRAAALFVCRRTRRARPRRSTLDRGRSIDARTMNDFTNRTFDEIEVGVERSVSRTLTATDVEALALAAGDVEGFHIEGGGLERPAVRAGRGGDRADRRAPQSPPARARQRDRRPAFHYAGTCHVGDTLTATVTAKRKLRRGPPDRVRVPVREPERRGPRRRRSRRSRRRSRRIAYANVATPEIVLRRNDGFAKLFKRCEALPPITCAIVHPCDRDSLLGPLEAARRGLIVPVPGRARGEDPRGRQGGGRRSLALPDRRRRAQPCRCRESGRNGARRRTSRR